MKQLNFIRQNIINTLTSSINTVEEAYLLIEKDFEGCASLEKTSYVLLNRKMYLLEIFNALNEEEKKLLLISGFQGTGKTEILKTMTSCLEDNIQSYYYECSKITNLDDMILSLFGFIKRISRDNPEYKRSFKVSANQSIDKRLINILKNHKMPLLIVIDGFENLTSDDFNLCDPEIGKFLNYLLKIDHIKLVISGKVLPDWDYELEENNFLQLKLSGLEKPQALQILKDKGINETDSLLFQIFETTRGYPESILLFISAINILNQTPFEIIKEYSLSKSGFEEFSYKSIFNNLPESCHKLAILLSIVRHGLKLNVITGMNITSDADKCLETLKEGMIVTVNHGVYQIKSLIKDIIYNSIPTNEKILLHRFLHEFYTEQITKKLEDRIIHISRKLLNSEQYYHYINSINLKNEYYNPVKSKQNIKNIAQSYANNAEHLANFSKTMKDSGFWDESLIDKTEIAKDPVNNIHVKGYTENTISDLSEGLDLELTEEEKALLQEEFSPVAENNTVIKSRIAEIPVKKVSVEENKQTSVEIVDGYIQTAKVLELENKLDTALDIYKKAYDVSKKMNDLPSMGKIAVSIGDILFQNRKYNEAITHLKNALQAYDGLKDYQNLNKVLSKMANAYNSCYKHDVALQYYSRVLNSPEKNISKSTEVDALSGVADIYNYRKDFNQALNYYMTAFSKAEELNDIGILSRLYFKIALNYDDLNNFEKAKAFYKKNIETSDNIETNPYIAASYANLAIICEEKQDTEKAVEYYLKSLESDKLLNNLEGQYESLSKLGNIYFDLGNLEKAYSFFQEELKVAKQANNPYWIAMSYLDIGDYYLLNEHYEKATKAFFMARKVIGKTISTDSKEKIDRRINQIIKEIGEPEFKMILENLKKKHA